MHQMGLLKAMIWAPAFGGHPIQWSGHLSSPTMHHTPHCSGASSIYLYGCSTLLNEPMHQNSIPLLSPAPENGRGPMLGIICCPGEELDHSIQCMCYGNKGIVSPGERRRGEMLFYSWGYLGDVCWQVTQSSGLLCRQVTACGHDLHNHCQQVPQGERKGAQFCSHAHWC